eukprot:5114281-Prymnesium_polylepis.1
MQTHACRRFRRTQGRNPTGDGVSTVNWVSLRSDSGALREHRPPIPLGNKWESGSSPPVHAAC